MEKFDFNEGRHPPPKRTVPVALSTLPTFFGRRVAKTHTCKNDHAFLQNQAWPVLVSINSFTTVKFTSIKMRQKRYLKFILFSLIM